MPKDKSTDKTKKWGGHRNYDFTPEADELLGELKKKLGITRNELANKAIVQLALANGLSVKGKKKEESVQSLAKKYKELEKTIAALCRNAFYFQFEKEDQVTKAMRVTNEVIQKAIGSGTRRNVKSLWKAIKKKELPGEVRYRDTFRIYIKGYGIPKKESDKLK